MPQIGLGTLFNKGKEVYETVKSAVGEHGYLMIDTASGYENEDQIGEALKECFA